MRIAYVNVFVTDLERSIGFFEKTLGLVPRTADTGHGYVSFDAGTVQIGLAQVAPDDQENRALVGRHTGIGFDVDDLVARHAELVEKGVTFPMPPERQPWGGFMALFADPDGNVYYLDQISAASEA